MFLTFITRITTIIDDWYYNISLYNVNIYIRRQQIKDWFLRHTYDSTHTHTHKLKSNIEQNKQLIKRSQNTNSSQLIRHNFQTHALV